MSIRYQPWQAGNSTRSFLQQLQERNRVREEARAQAITLITGQEPEDPPSPNTQNSYHYVTRSPWLSRHINLNDLSWQDLKVKWEPFKPSTNKGALRHLDKEPALIPRNLRKLPSTRGTSTPAHRNFYKHWNTFSHRESYRKWDTFTFRENKKNNQKNWDKYWNLGHRNRRWVQNEDIIIDDWRYRERIGQSHVSGAITSNDGFGNLMHGSPIAGRHIPNEDIGIHIDAEAITRLSNGIPSIREVSIGSSSNNNRSDDNTLRFDSEGITIGNTLYRINSINRRNEEESPPTHRLEEDGTLTRLISD